MEASKEPISVRSARVNAELTSTNTNSSKTKKCRLLSREILLDAVQVLYEECSSEILQKSDPNIGRFVEKFKNDVKLLKQLRVNIADFEVKNLIGRGQFGEVHVVKEKQTGDVFALKSLRKFSSEIKKNFYEEERYIMAYSSSVWLTKLHYAFQDNNCLYFVMDYHPGGDLLGLLYRQGGTVPESSATFYIAEIVLALEDLHKMGFVHRDIKPDNILLDRCGHLKLADFGSSVRLNKEGLVTTGPPVGTPDYIAPEVLQCLDNKNEHICTYGVSCDFWSLGILAYELTVGNPPFQGPSSASIYSKIMNHSTHLKFPPEMALTQGYVSFLKKLLTDRKHRLSEKDIKNHPLFKHVNFENLRDQVPPFVPKISAVDDTSNFSDVQSKKKIPSLESLKKRTHFSGRNLPFIGFTFTNDPENIQVTTKNNANIEDVENLKKEIEDLRRETMRIEELEQVKDGIERKLGEKSNKLENIETLRDKLEKDLAASIAESSALRRVLELERKERSELERKALDLIKAAKSKWENAEKIKIEALTLEIEQRNEKISQLSNTNKMLDEQLQHALKMEGKHKQSLEKVQDLSRRSVIGLEGRLERVTTATESKITELQTKLTNEIHDKNALLQQVSKLKEQKSELKQKLDISEKNYSDLKMLVNDAEMLVTQLREKVRVLEMRMQETEEAYSKELEHVHKKYEAGQKNLKDAENKNIVLQSDSKVLDEQKKEIDLLKAQISELQSRNRATISQLESQLREEKEKSSAHLKQMQQKENILTESQELKELRAKFWRMEKEFSNCKIDKRILERELKEAQAEIAELKEKSDSLNALLEEKKKTHESALLEISNINENTSMELAKMLERCKHLDEALNNEKKKHDEERSLTLELKQIITTKDKVIESLHAHIAEISGEKELFVNRWKKCEDDRCKLLRVIENLQKEKANIHNELEKSRRELDNCNLNLRALREACTLIEGQVIEYENINHLNEQKVIELNANTEKLISDLCVAKKEIQEANKRTNEEKSLKALSEAKIKRLEEDVNCLEKECDSYKQQCIEYKEYSTGLSDELTAAEERISELELTQKSYERQCDSFKAENKALKEEISDYLTQIVKLKESNYKLNRNVGQLELTKSELGQKVTELERVLNEKNNYYKEREMRSEATIQQQIKLIDYLQTKIDELPHKKKTLTEVFFGVSKKENQPILTLPLNYKDLESQLIKERKANSKLKQENFMLKSRIEAETSNKFLDEFASKDTARTDVLSPASKSAATELVESPEKLARIGRQNSSQRMRHKIPHRFESKICTRHTKCSQCSHQVQIGRNYNVCTECHIAAHTNCSQFVPKTCGLPVALAKHYKDTMQRLKGDNEKTENNGEIQTDIAKVESWIKVPGKSNGWDKRFAVLTDTSIQIYADQSKNEVIDSVQIHGENLYGHVLLEPSPSEIGVTNVAASDLPFIIKVEISANTTCWPSKCLIFMALSAKEKDAWFTALQKIFNMNLDKPNLDTVVKIVDDLDVNCLTQLTANISAVGCDNGLHCILDNKLVSIDGVSQVHHIAVFHPANLILMIVNSKSELISCDINHLINLTQCAPCSKVPLKFKNVNVSGLHGFHIVQTPDKSIKNQKKICVATNKQLVIMDFSYETTEFVPLRVLDTAQPIGCLLFTHNSLIVGADKFFEIDLHTMEAEEFLDVSDTKLRQTVTNCYKMNSYPLSIIPISLSPVIEYLVSFQEFSVFVDEYGRSTRDYELKRDHLPFSFYFAKDCLYILQFSGIEIIKITDDTCKESMKAISEVTARVVLDKFKYLGGSTKGVYVVHNSEIKFLNGRKYLEIDLLSESDEENGEFDNFSFTSSMVQSLDGHLSDDASEAEHKARKVTFSQTNL